MTIYPCDDRLRRMMRGWRDRHPDMPLRSLGKDIGYSHSVLSRYLAPEGNQYSGDVTKLEDKLREFLKAQEGQGLAVSETVALFQDNAQTADILGGLVRVKLRELGRTQSTLREQCAISKGHMSRIYHGKCVPSFTIFIRLVLALGMDARDVVERITLGLKSETLTTDKHR